MNPQNSEVAKAMRAFGSQEIQLGLWQEHNSDLSKEQKKILYGSTWFGVASGLALVALAVLFIILVPGRADVSEPFASNLPFWWFIEIALLALNIYLISKRDKLNTRRLILFAKVNGFSFIPYATAVPGDLRDGVGTFRAFKLNSNSGKYVSFGIIHAWFDPDHKWLDHGRRRSGGPGADPELLLYARVEVKQFNGSISYFTPERAPTRDQLPSMTDQAYNAVCDLAKRYAVVIGEGAILVSACDGVINSLPYSLKETDLGYATRWAVLQRIIGGKLADIVEGLQE